MIDITSRNILCDSIISTSTNSCMSFFSSSFLNLGTRSIPRNSIWRFKPTCHVQGSLKFNIEYELDLQHIPSEIQDQNTKFRGSHIVGPGLDHIFIWLGPDPSHPTPPMSPSLPSLSARTCVGTLPSWETNVKIPHQYITNIQVDITFIIPKLIDGIPSHVKRSLMA